MGVDELGRIIAFMNQKGGVGKTTSTYNCAAALVRMKKKVLLIDLDPQASLTKSLGKESAEIAHTVYEFLKRQCSFDQCVQSREDLLLLPSSIKLAAADQELVSEHAREFLLKNALGKYLKRFDYVLIDCPPSLGILSINAMVAATEILIVLETDNYSLYGAADLWKTIEVIQDRLNPRLKITGVLANAFDRRNNLDRESLALIRKNFPKLVFKTVIRQNIALSEAPGNKMDIFSYDLKSHGAEDFMKLTKELVERGKRA